METQITANSVEYNPFECIVHAEWGSHCFELKYIKHLFLWLLSNFIGYLYWFQYIFRHNESMSVFTEVQKIPRTWESANRGFQSKRLIANSKVQMFLVHNNDEIKAIFLVCLSSWYMIEESSRENIIEISVKDWGTGHDATMRKIV